MKLKALLLSTSILMTLTSCSSPGQQLGTDVTLACTMFVNPDEYRVGVLMVLGSGGNAYSYIDGAVKELKYPGVTDTLETQDIKEKFAAALKTFAFAYTTNEKVLQSEASKNLDAVAETLKSRCIEIGMDYSGL